MKPIIRMTFVLAAGVLAFTGNTARAGSHEVTVTGARGTTFQRDVTRADGQAQVTDTTTGPNGAIRTRDVDRSAAST